MEPQEKLTTQQFIIDRLHNIQRNVENGKVDDALAELKEVKAADTKNIYLIALEKQILKLKDPATPPEGHDEIIKSLTPMIERAISDSQRRLAEKAQEPKESKEKEAALEKLKSQYLQRADEYVEKGDYNHALEEIRRIYIIDPGNVVAKEYEQKIEQLIQIKKKSEQEQKTVQKEPPVQEQQKEEIKKSKVVEAVEEETEEKGKSKIIIIATAAVVIAAIGIWLLISGGESTEQKQTTVQEQTETPQTAATEQPSVPATTPPPSSSKEQKNGISSDQKVSETKPQPSQQTTQQQAPQQKTVEVPKPTTPTVSEQSKQTSQQPSQPEVKQPSNEVASASTSEPTPTPAPVQTPAPTPTEEAAAPKPFVAIESPPQIVKREAPKYPEIAYRMRMEGRVVVEVTVDPQGKPIQAKVARSTSDVFNDAAIEAAMKSTYKPAMMSTGPVTAKVLVQFDFKLR